MRGTEQRMRAERKPRTRETTRPENRHEFQRLACEGGRNLGFSEPFHSKWMNRNLESH